MSIFDIFTGDPVSRAASEQRGIYDLNRTNNMGAIGEGLTNARNAVTRGGTFGRDAITSGYGTARGDVSNGNTSALNYIDQGMTGGLDYLGRASGQYEPLAALASRYGDSTRLYQDALGVNGADAAGAARDAFTPSVAYGFNMDQGIEAINRRRAAGGMLNSGNADRDATEFASGLASKESNGWLDRLAGFINPELAATQGVASGRAGLDAQAAGLVSGAGAAKAGIAGNQGRTLAELATGQGQALAGSYTGEGNNLASLAQGAAGQIVGANNSWAQPYAQTYGADAQGQMQASGNLWNFAQNSARMAAGAMGGMPSGGGTPMMSGGYNVGATGGGNPFPMPM